MTEFAIRENRIAYRTVFLTLLLTATLTVASACEGGVQSTETPTATPTPTATTATPAIAHDYMDVPRKPIPALMATYAKLKSAQ